MRRRIPAREIVEAGRPETGLGGPEQQPHDVEMKRRSNEHHGGGDQPPADHDPDDPAARTVARHHHARRNLEQRIGQEEQAAAESVNGGAEPQVDIHLSRREADVYSIEVGAEIAQPEERNDSPRCLGDRAIGNRFGMPHACPPSSGALASPNRVPDSGPNLRSPEGHRGGAPRIWQDSGQCHPLVKAPSALEAKLPRWRHWIEGGPCPQRVESHRLALMAGMGGKRTCGDIEVARDQLARRA